MEYVEIVFGQEAGGPSDFLGWAKAFLQAIALSRAGLPAEIERTLIQFSDLDFPGFKAVITTARNDLRGNGWYDGFSYSPKDSPSEVSWRCKTPSRAISEQGDSITTIYLEEVRGAWQIRVTARDLVTAEARIRAAQGLAAQSVPRRIVANTVRCKR